MQKHLCTALSASLLALAVSVPAVAHHSFAVFDFQTQTAFDGTIETVKFRNPHIALTLKVKNPDGSEKPEFVLNKPAYRKAKILVAGDNFGCGSSREHAPWALLDYGIRCVISTSFADIFYNNCFQNGILPAKVSKDDLKKLMDDASRGANATLTIDLEKQEIKGPDGGVVKFEIDEFNKHCLLNGLDAIGLTLVKEGQIKSFEDKHNARPWA